MQQAALRLFKAVQVKDPTPREIPREVTERTLRHGYILDSIITPTDELLDTIEGVIGLGGEQANAAFHKSWSVVQEAALEALVLQQIVHYLTTYGFEALGIFREDTVYVPAEALDLPALGENIPLVVVKGMDGKALIEAIVNLGSGIALSPETLADIMTIIEANEFDPSFVEKIGNRELKIKLFDYYGYVPEEPVEFLRYLVFQLTGESLLIKNDRLIEKIKESKGSVLDSLLENAPENLASVFYRYKPLFLALKSISRNKTFFNRLRKRAPKQHQPLPEDYLGSITSQIKRGILDPSKLRQSLVKASVFRKVRLAYALQHRLLAGQSIVYRVRNGRGWATEFSWSEELAAATQSALDQVLESLVDQIRPNLEGKRVLIPPGVRYALPATEKQFTGHLPSGSSLEAPEDLIVGIHWTNTQKRVDLDLSVVGETGKIGWDADYRSEDHRVLFSGDMTNAPAPRGASELFYLRSGLQEAKVLMLNYYNFAPGDSVAAKILVADEKPERFGENYMVDPNKIIMSATINVTQKQNILGLLATKNGKTRIHFAHLSLGTSITSANNIHSTHARNFLVHSLLESLDFEEILTQAGATVLREKNGEEDIDLSPERLNKSTILDLLT